MRGGWTGEASDIVKAKSSGEDPRSTGDLVSNLPHTQVNKQRNTSRQLSTSYIHYLHTNTSLQTHIHVCRVHCGSAFEPGASGLPYYFTPLLCVPDAIGALAVWRQKKTKNEGSQVCRLYWRKKLENSPVKWIWNWDHKRTSVPSPRGEGQYIVGCAQKIVSDGHTAVVPNFFAVRTHNDAALSFYGFGQDGQQFCQCAERVALFFTSELLAAPLFAAEQGLFAKLFILEFHSLL